MFNARILISAVHLNKQSHGERETLETKSRHYPA